MKAHQRGPVRRVAASTAVILATLVLTSAAGRPGRAGGRRHGDGLHGRADAAVRRVRLRPHRRLTGPSAGGHPDERGVKDSRAITRRPS